MAVPKLRFPEFTDDWEQRKLFEMATFSKGSGYSKADLAPSGTPIILYGRMYTKYETIIKEVDTFAEEKAGSVYSKGGEVIVPASGETAEDISRASVVENTGVLLGGDINIIHPNDNLIPGFLALTISNGNQQKKLSAKAQGASIVHLHNEDLKDVDILYPTIAEQRKISEFFQGLDDTITLHQRKLDDIKLLKKSMLQKMFPAEGRDVPEVRFPGFTAAWEQRKLGDLYTERNERGNGSLQILSVSIHTGVSDGELDVDNLGKFVRRSEDKSTYKHVHSGDLIFNMMRAWQGAIGVAKTEGMISPAYISAIPSEDIYPPFMNYLLRRKNVINQINNLSYGVTDFRKRLYWNSFVQVNCKLPSVEEQRNITDVFEKIDHLITLHQRKCDDLQKLKKALLQQMFC